MIRKSLLLALPFVASSCLLLSACSDNNDLASNNDASDNGPKIVLDFNNTGNTPATRVSVSSEYEKGYVDGGVPGIRQGADNDGRSPFGADNVESTGKLVKALAYSFDIGDKLYVYDETSHDISTFTCSKVEDNSGSTSTAVGASAPKAVEFTATDLKTITAGSPIYLFTNNKPTWDGTNLSFTFDTDSKKNYAFGRNGSKLDGTQFTGFQKVAAAPDFSAMGSAYHVRATLDETPVMVTYHDDITQDFAKLTMNRSVIPFGGSTRGHYTTATYDFANNTLIPGTFVNGYETYIWDGTKSTDTNTFYSNDGAHDRATTYNGKTGRHVEYDGGRTTYVPLMPGKYAEVRYLVTGELPVNADGTTTTIQFLATKKDATNGFEVKKNEYFNFGSISDANHWGQVADKGYEQLNATSMYIIGDATQYGWDKGTDTDSTYAYTIAQRMVNNGDQTFTYIGKPLSKDKGTQLLPTTTRNAEGKNKYIFYFGNSGQLEAPGLFMSDNSYKTPGDATTETVGTHRAPGSAATINGSKNSLFYYSTKKDHYTSDGCWELPMTNNTAGNYYKFKVNLKTRMVEVTPFTGGLVGDNENNTNSITLPTSPLYITVPQSSSNSYEYTSPTGHAKYSADYATNGHDQATKDLAGQDVRIDKLWITGTAIGPRYDYARTSAVAVTRNLAFNAKRNINAETFVWEGYLKKGYLRFPYIFGAKLSQNSKFLSAKYTGDRRGVNGYWGVNALDGRYKADGTPAQLLVYPVSITAGFQYDMTVEKDYDEGGDDCEWYIGTPGWYRILIDIKNMKVTFAQVNESLIRTGR